MLGDLANSELDGGRIRNGTCNFELELKVVQVGRTPLVGPPQIRIAEQQLLDAAVIEKMYRDLVHYFIAWEKEHWKAGN